MRIKLKEKNIMRLALNGIISRKIYLYKNNQLNSELFIQKRDMVYTNFYSLIQRLKNGEIDEIRYSPSKNDVISIILNKDNFYTLEYFTKNKEKEAQLLKIVKKSNKK